MSPTLRIAARLLLFVGALSPAACGYTTTRLDAWPEARTVAVVPFENTGYRRDLELRLTQAVADEIRARTSLALTTPAAADLVVSGQVDASEQTVIQNLDRTAALQRLDGTLTVTVRERRTGRVLRQQDVSTYQEFRPGRLEERVDGRTTDAWVARVARRVVDLLERQF